MNQLKNILIRMLETAEQWLLPDRCCHCSTQGYGFCPTCQQSIKITPVRDLACGSKIPIYSLSAYEGAMKSGLHSVKFSSRSDIADLLGQHIANHLPTPVFSEIDEWITVPIHPAKKKQRGFNQVELLFKRFFEKFEIQPRQIVERISNTPSLYSLDKDRRKKVLVQGFKIINPSQIKNKNVVLLDDILTTGSTLNEIATQIKHAGASQVFGLTIAKSG